MRTEAGDREAQEPDAADPVVRREADVASPGETVAHLANRAARSHPSADLALVLGDVEPPAGWLQCLRRCAASESTTATVSALPGPLAEHAAAEDELVHADPAVLCGNVGLPRVDLVGGACVFVARAAYELLGGLDETMPTGAGALADFGLRARQLGLANLLAGKLLVPASGTELTDRDRSELARRFPTLWQAAQEPPSAAVEHAALLARTTLRKPTVTIDARSLGAQVGGTQVYALELIRALSQTGEVDIRALVGPEPEAKAMVEALGVTSVITYEQAVNEPAETDLVHRPQQVFTVDDLDLLRPLGRRLVITHLDLIAYHNPTYFPGLGEWQRHVRATRIAFDVADHLLFFSTHALRDAEREDLVDAARASVVPLGVNPDAPDDAPVTRPTALAERAEPFLLCIGADYAHKNRPFALELTAELRRAHGWRGSLVLAGGHVAHGSSADAERHVTETLPELDQAVVDLGTVSDAERRWLMAHADALVYPTLLEGFGLVPFEAAAAGVPCLYARQSSLAELLPAELATLDGWDLERASARAARLLTDPDAREAHVAALRRACSAYDLSRCAEQTIVAYRNTLASPARSSGRGAWEALEREREIVRLDKAVSDVSAEHRSLLTEHRSLLKDIGEDGLALVGPGGLLSRADRRTLLALVARPGLRRPLFALGRAGYRVAHRGRDRR
jgi:glycosyltransferase involved in cell wall biosynthesis